jgi:hypothetical protein
MATASRFNRGYSGGLAANRRPTTGLAANRRPTTGLAGGSQPGGAFGSSFQSSFQTNVPAMTPAAVAEQPKPEEALMGTAQPQPNAQPPDFSNMFSPQPLPTLGQQSFTQQPPSPFGPQPLPYGGARADGGPVQPGRAYMVGERGPEMIVPQQPGMVIPSEAIRSGSLASRPAVPVGRGMTPQRRLEQMQRRALAQGDNRTVQNIAQTFFNAEQWGRGGLQRMPMMPPLPRPSGPGAMVPPRPSAPNPTAPAPMPPQPMPAAETQQAMPPPMQAPVDFSNMLPPMPMGQMPGGGFNPQAPLPPSRLPMPPPQFQVQQVGGWDVFVQNMPDGSQKFLNARNTPEAPVPQPPPLSAAQVGQLDAAGFEPTQIGGRSADAQGVDYLKRKPAPKAPETRTFKRGMEEVTMQWNPDRNGWEPIRFLDANNDGIDDRTQGGGGAYTTPGGVQVQLVPDQASAPTMQTGQMPNEAYANPLTPEQSLAAARQEYAATGNDAALRRHFQQFPSASTRLVNEEAKIWKKIGEQVDAYGRAIADRGAARQRRDQWINRDTAGNPIIQGASAQRYASTFPETMKSIDQQMPTLDLSLIQQANNLNKIAQTRRAMNLR